MTMSNNARMVWITLILTIGAIILITMINYGILLERLKNEPIVFRIEANDNMVKVAQAVNGTTTCQPAKCECGSNWYWNSYNSTLINYSYYNNPNWVYV